MLMPTPRQRLDLYVDDFFLELRRRCLDAMPVDVCQRASF